MARLGGDLLTRVAAELDISEEDLLKRGVQTYLEARLRQVNAEILELTGRYGVSGVEDMERKYRTGELEEADSWRDLQRLDRLEYERDRLAKLIEEAE